MPSPCCGAPTYSAPFWVGSDVRYTVEMCHKLTAHGTIACKKPVAVFSRDGRPVIGVEAVQVLSIAKTGVFAGTVVDGKIVPVVSLEEDIRVPKTFIEASAGDE